MSDNDTSLDLWLIRHGRTVWNSQGRIQGQSESDLDDIGQQQARALGLRLRSVAFDGIHCSDLERTKQTAALAFPEDQVLLEPRLREIAGGVLEGKTAVEMSAEEREIIRRQDGRNLLVRPPGGESYLDVAERLGGWLDDLPASGCYACVTHEAVIYTLLVMVMDVMGKVEVGPQIELRNTGITQIRFVKGMPTIVRINDAAHLSSIEAPLVKT